jgi:CRP/FNR family transcriptional regulator, cyclic AMP receptor protein
MDAIGLAAAVCVLATFCMKSMLALRAFAMASNMLFTAYGAGADLFPIVVLHAIFR